MKIINVAEYIVDMSTKLNMPCTNLLLNRILFEIQKKGTKEFNRYILDETFEAWPIGPICPTIYYRFCGFGAEPILLSFSNSIDIFTGEDSELHYLVDKIANKMLAEGNRNPLYALKDKPTEWERVYTEKSHNPIYFC